VGVRIEEKHEKNEDNVVAIAKKEKKEEVMMEAMAVWLRTRTITKNGLPDPPKKVPRRRH